MNFRAKKIILFLSAYLVMFIYGNIANSAEVTLGSGDSPITLDSKDLHKIEKFSADWAGTTFDKCNHYPYQKRSIFFLTNENIKAEFTHSFRHITHNCMSGKHIPNDILNTKGGNAYGFSLTWSIHEEHPNLIGTLKLINTDTKESKMVHVKIWGNSRDRETLLIKIDDHPQHSSGPEQNNNILSVTFDGFKIKSIQEVDYKPKN